MIRFVLIALLGLLIAPVSAWPLGFSIGGGETDSRAVVRTAAVVLGDSQGTTMSFVAHAFDDGLGYRQRNVKVSRDDVHSEYFSGVLEWKRRYPAAEYLDITYGVRGGVRGTRARISGITGANGKVDVEGGDADFLALLYFFAWDENPAPSIAGAVWNTVIAAALGYAFRDSGAIVPYYADGFSLGGSWHTAQRGLKLELDLTVIALPLMNSDSDKPSKAEQFHIEYNPKHILMTTLSLVWVF